MTTTCLRAAVTGLLAFAASEEETLITTAADDTGDRNRWAAVPTLAHIAEFKSQQTERVVSVLAARTPPDFAEIDHTSEPVYARYSARPAGAVLGASREVTAALIDGVRALPDEDLLDPSRHRWLRGRTLWLQIVVRGFWHPTGHLAGYYCQHGQPERAVALQAHALATARYVRAPEQATGLAAYGLACAQATAGRAADAARTLAEAIALNTDVRVNAARDPDLASLRATGELDRILRV